MNKIYSINKARAEIVKIFNRNISMSPKVSSANHELDYIPIYQNASLYLQVKDDASPSNYISSMRNICENSPMLIRNYSIFKLMAFYKDIKEMPNELKTLFEELKIDVTTTIFSEIERLQDILVQNIDNMYNFIDDSTTYAMKKYENEGELDKAKYMNSKRVHSIQKKNAGAHMVTKSSMSNQNIARSMAQLMPFGGKGSQTESLNKLKEFTQIDNKNYDNNRYANEVSMSPIKTLDNVQNLDANAKNMNSFIIKNYSSQKNIIARKSSSDRTIDLKLQSKDLRLKHFNDLKNFQQNFNKFEGIKPNNNNKFEGIKPNTSNDVYPKKNSEMNQITTEMNLSSQQTQQIQTLRQKSQDKSTKASDLKIQSSKYTKSCKPTLKLFRNTDGMDLKYSKNIEKVDHIDHLDSMVVKSSNLDKSHGD